MANTRLWYSYKPHTGAPVTDCLVLDGELSAEDLESIRQTLHQGVHFIPDQVGLPSLNNADADAHAWHKLDVSVISATTQRPSVLNITAKAIAHRFQNVIWNPALESARLHGVSEAKSNPSLYMKRQFSR